MKKLLLCISLAALLPVMSYGQVRLGVKAGLNVSEFSLSSDMLDKSNIAGFSGGLALDVNVPILGLGVSSGLLYTQRGAELTNEAGDSESIRISYLDIPVFLKWNIKIPLSPVGVFIQGGPYFSLALNDKDAKDIYAEFGDFNNFDIGLGLGGGVSLFSKVEVGAYYGWGLKKVYENNDVKNRGWNITAAYFF
jgi:hypothetical protein